MPTFLTTRPIKIRGRDRVGGTGGMSTTARLLRCGPRPPAPLPKCALDGSRYCALAIVHHCVWDRSARRDRCLTAYRGLSARLFCLSVLYVCLSVGSFVCLF